MAVIVRIDVDRAYGRNPFSRHVLSRISSDFWLPRFSCAGYLRELEEMLRLLGECGARAHVFFRRCTIPSSAVRSLIKQGGHRAGLHLENSRSFETFSAEIRHLERRTGYLLDSFSKHGSGQHRYGWRHYRHYEPENYLQWAAKTGMKAFFGNLEDPTLAVAKSGKLTFFPAAFWLEPFWRDTRRFTVDWLMSEAEQRDVVLLVHPENVLADAALCGEFRRIISNSPTRLIE